MIGSILVAISLFAASATPALAQAGPKQKAVVHLPHYTDNLHAAKMSVHLAYLMQTMGADVILLLDLEGVSLADTRQPGDLGWGKGEPISKESEAFVKAGGQMPLCPHCSKHISLTSGHLRPGARIGNAENWPSSFLLPTKCLPY
jgi:predicted peroxiredoxin